MIVEHFPSSSASDPSADTIGTTPRVARSVAAGAALVATLVADPAGAWTFGVDKWWTNKFGEFDSGRWDTQRRNTQRLIVDRCDHNWGPADQGVRVELREHKAWMPDVSHGAFKYACNAGNHLNNNDNDADITWVSGQTNSTSHFFKWDPNVDMRSSGIIEIDHS